MRRWCKALGLIGSGALFMPIAILVGRPAFMRSALLTVRGAGRIAAEFGVYHEEYRDPR